MKKIMTTTKKILMGVLIPIFILAVCLGTILPITLKDERSIPTSTPSVEEGSKWSERVLAVAETGDVILDADITGASSADASLKGGSIILDGGTFVMGSGKITGHERVYGGAIFIGNGATFTMNGGEISGNKAKYGGAIYVANGGHCIINGGKITANKSEVGPAIYVESGGNLEVGAGAEIVDNIQEPYDQNTPDEPVAPDGYMYFGEYPKTIKASDVTISGSPDAKGYYTGSDGAKYAKVVVDFDVKSLENLGVLDNLSDGSTITAGAEFYFKVEKILWRILEQKNGTALLVTDNAIDSIVYQQDHTQSSGDYLTSANGAPAGTYANNYKYSNIRNWLNNNFYNSAFSDSDKAKILMTEVDNSVESTMETNNKYVCENTNDNVFLLSVADVYNAKYGFNSDTSTEDAKRTFINTDFTKAKGAITITQELADEPYIGTGFYWLRSPKSNSIVCSVGQVGNVMSYNVDNAGMGVACALRVSVSDAPVDLGEDISVDLYVDGVKDQTATVKSKQKIGDLEFPISDETCCGFFLNPDLTMSLDKYADLTVEEALASASGARSVAATSISLFTKTATPEKLAFTLTSNNTYSVKASEMTITGTVVIPRKYNGKLVDRLFEVDMDIQAILDGTATSMPDGAFMCCAGVSEIYMPSSITNIANAFIGNLTQATDYAFSNTNIHDCVTRIGHGAFAVCVSYAGNLELPEGLTEIGDYAFTGNLQLVGALELPDTLQTMGIYAFAQCSGFTSLSTGNGIEQIPVFCFGECLNISNVVIGENVKTLGTASFAGVGTSSQGGSLKIPASVSSIGVVSFMGANFASVEVDSANTHFTSRDKSGNKIPGIIDIANKELLFGCDETALVADGSIEKIASGAFEMNKKITSIIIPESVTEIEGEAFMDSSLESVTFAGTGLSSNSLNIGVLAFSNCSSLTRVNCDIGKWLKINFQDETANPLYYAHNLYQDGSLVQKVFVYSETSSSDSLAGWVTVQSDINKLNDYCFSGATCLTNFSINSLTISTIGVNAFNGCSNLISIQFGDEIKSIKSGAFKNCSKLERVEYVSIDDWCSINFEDEYSNPLYYANEMYSFGNRIEKFIIDATNIRRYAFVGFKGTQKIFISSSVLSIESRVFWNCSSSLEIYTDVASESEVPSRWGNYWNDYSSNGKLSVHYGVSKEEFETM